MTSLYSSHLFLVSSLPLLSGSTSLLAPLLHCPPCQSNTLWFSAITSMSTTSKPVFLAYVNYSFVFPLLVGHLHIDMPPQKQNIFELNLPSSPYKCTPLPNIYICVSMSNLSPGHPITLPPLSSSARFPSFAS